MENNNPKDIAELVAGSLEDFRKGMEAREQLSIRIGRRTTQIIRFGMTGMVILGIIMFYLIFILTKDFSSIRQHMTEMSGYMNNMDSNLVTMAVTMNRLQETMLVLNDNVAVMPALNTSVGSMDKNLGSLSVDLNSLLRQIEHMNGNVAGMAGNLQLLNNQFADMNRTVGGMAANMHELSKPMKMMPFF